MQFLQSSWLHVRQQNCGSKKPTFNTQWQQRTFQIPITSPDLLINPSLVTCTKPGPSNPYCNSCRGNDFTHSHGERCLPHPSSSIEMKVRIQLRLLHVQRSRLGGGLIRTIDPGVECLFGAAGMQGLAFSVVFRSISLSGGFL